jgi:hypothetical protein
MPDLNLIETAKGEVYKYAWRHLDKTDDVEKFTIENVYVVWFCRTLKNWKALVSTDLLDGTYYEVTYDGATESIYLDVYKKFDNVEIIQVQAGGDLANLEALRKDWAKTE